MRTHLKRETWRIMLRFALGLAVVVMLAACASEPAKTAETPGQPPPEPTTTAPAAGPTEPPASTPPPGVAQPARPTPAAPPAGTAPAPGAPTAPPSAAPPAKVPPAPAAATPVFPEGTTFFVHTIKYPGETVSIIAAWYLGDKMRFDVLAAANPEINPRLIRAGMKIKVPENLMKTREPLPKEFVDGFYRRPPTEKSPGSAKEDEPVPIGPK